MSVMYNDGNCFSKSDWILKGGDIFGKVILVHNCVRKRGLPVFYCNDRVVKKDKTGRRKEMEKLYAEGMDGRSFDGKKSDRRESFDFIWEILENTWSNQN